MLIFRHILLVTEFFVLVFDMSHWKNENISNLVQLINVLCDRELVEVKALTRQIIIFSLRCVGQHDYAIVYYSKLSNFVYL